MRPIGLYEWIAGSQHEFTRQFQDNEQLFNQALRFWNQLNGAVWSILIAMAVIGIGIAIYYYTAYNNHPHRHYTFLKWLMWLGITILSTFFVSIVLLYFFAEPKLKGAGGTELLISLGNSIYAGLIYFITSAFWCNVGTTNAYRLFKI